jgi:hypothetical protein
VNWDAASSCTKAECTCMTSPWADTKVSHFPSPSPLSSPTFSILARSLRSAQHKALGQFKSAHPAYRQLEGDFDP